MTNERKDRYNTTTIIMRVLLPEDNERLLDYLKESGIKKADFVRQAIVDKLRKMI